MSLSLDTLRWILAAHVVGFIVWVGSMFGTMHLLAAHADAVGETRAVLARLARRTALAMDIGATLAIVAGLLILFGVEPSPLELGWMRIKLGAAVGLIGLHGLLRVKVSKAGRGEQRVLPPWMQPALPLLVIAIVVLAIVRP